MERKHFVVTYQSARLQEPAKGPLDNPPLGQHMKSFLVVAAFDDFESHPQVPDDRSDFMDQLARVPAIGPDYPQPAEGLAQPCQQELACPVSVLDIR